MKNEINDVNIVQMLRRIGLNRDGKIEIKEQILQGKTGSNVLISKKNVRISRRTTKGLDHHYFYFQVYNQI